MSLISVESSSFRKENVPQGDNKAEAPKSMPDSLPLTAVFSNSENAFMHLLDANRRKLSFMYDETE